MRHEPLPALGRAGFGDPPLAISLAAGELFSGGRRTLLLGKLVGPASRFRLGESGSLLPLCEQVVLVRGQACSDRHCNEQEDHRRRKPGDAWIARTPPSEAFRRPDWPSLDRLAAEPAPRSMASA